MKQKRLLSTLLCLLLSLTLSLPALAAEPFSDVPADSWYAEAADYCADRGLMQGVGGMRFCPEAAVTRAMAVTVLHRISGSPAASAHGAFSDISAGAWYAEAADWAAETGISSGVGSARFAPDDAVLRQDLAVLLWRLAGSPEGAEPSGFTDEDSVSAYALDAVRWAAELGIVTGMDDGSFAPRGGAKRAQLAVMLMRMDRDGLLIRPDNVDALHSPCGIALTESGRLLVADSYYKRVWSVNGGAITSYAGADSAPDGSGAPGGGYLDGTRLRSLFLEPWGIAPFLNGWAVSDAGSNALRLVTATQVLTINGAPGEAGLDVSDMGVVYDRPTGLAADDEGCLYVSDTGSGTIRHITPDGIVTVYARELSEPTGLCWYDGSLYVAETDANRILRITGGSVEVLAGSGAADYVDGDAHEAAFCAPIGLAAGPDGTIYVADMVNGAVRAISGGQVRTLYSADQPCSPMGLALQGNTLWVTDNYTGQLLELPLE